MFGKKILMIAAIASIALTQTACIGQVVDAGNVGVKVKSIGSDAGVSPTPVTTGWNMKGFGEKIIEIPVTQKVYAFSKKNGEVIVFSDSSGMNVWGDVALTVRINPAMAPKVYEKYRSTLDELVNLQIRNSLRSAMNEEGEKFSSEELYQGKKSVLIQNALVRMQKSWAGTGVEIVNLEWSGTIHYPDSVMAAIESKTTKMQQAEAAKADEAKAIAEANALVAKADGEARATRIRGDALRANPQILQQEWIAKWDGVLPTTVTGANTMMMVGPK